MIDYADRSKDPPMNAIVVYYSLNGHTATVCQAVAKSLGADTRQISAPAVKTGGWAMLRWGFSALRHGRTEISLPKTDFASAELVVLGAQVWAGRLSTPMRSFLMENPDLPTSVALILTSGGTPYPKKAMDEFAGLADRPVIAKLHVSEKMLKSDEFDPAIAAFCDRISAYKPLAR